MGFRKMALNEKTMKALEELGYYKPTEVQQKVIPLILQGENLIVRSQTGTGKTAAFGIGLIELLDVEREKKALVLAPTRELAVQISEELKGIAKEHHHKIAVVYGGQKIDVQIRALRKGVDILIATPGRLVDHSERGTVNLSEYSIVVLDEADEMLDMGFKDEMDRIMGQVPEKRTVLLFSATLDELILELASHYIKGPAETIEIGEKERAKQIKEDFVQVSRRKKFANLKRILGQGQYKKVLIFMSTKRGVDYLHERLKESSYRAEAIHGDMSQGRRERVMSSFKSGKTHILVASDVAARGIHVEDIELIVNYDEAQDADTHLHRVGRTGRMGKEGKAVTFIESREEEDKDRNRDDHPDFAWMKGGGERKMPPRGERRRAGASDRDRRRRPRAHEKKGRRNYGPAKKKRRR
ncbi:DEAD/DEAH box helicase [Candidatus Micrarchaeota archaeon]|nr:DEAD/DEAH box helicase [Candidatus Micrarchaeota archaeon]MBD3418340.1 DEAD/DEAH box helicase [Candidatus Micrarchaeota archaeon]